MTMGRQGISTPVLADYNNRAPPLSFEGASVVSEVFNNLSLRAGSFDRVSPRMSVRKPA
ncbi:OprD family porin [Pseudomonas fluorescens]|uniref:OprD family porin n=1 Tax=Pseudomonas fluorescens TaxID=294 RepID=UPI0021E51C8E|nr:OprD family porin [Pseudomonas fluorescens]